MNESLRKREPGAPSVNDIVTLARSLSASLGSNPEYARTAAKSNGDKARSMPSSNLAVPQVTTDLRADRLPQSSTSKHAATMSELDGLNSTPDDGSIHDSSIGSPVDAVAAFLNARPAHNSAAAHQDWESSEPDGGGAAGMDSQTFLLTMILDALRQGVEVYSRVVS